MRALIVVRLSRLTDASTSPERQIEACQRVCDERGWNVVGTAQDLDVSAGTTSPFDRPALKEWLDAPTSFDVIVFYRMDRLVRRAVHLWDVIRYADENNVNLVSATEPFDMSTTLGRMLANMIASVAEMELDAIKERNASAYYHNRAQGKWTGGVPFWGYLPERDEHGNWRYGHDPVLAPVVREVAQRIINGETLRTVTHSLNDRGVPTTRDRFREWQRKPLKGFQYSITSVQRALRSQALLGYSVVRDLITDDNGKSVLKNGRKQYTDWYVLRDSEGAPVQRGPALLDRETFDQLQAALDQRQRTGNYTHRSTALLLRVIYCGVCHRPMYTIKGRNHRYYRCEAKNHRKPCRNKMVRVDHADELVTESLLDEYGDLKRRKAIYEPGEDHSSELAEVTAELRDVASLVGTGPYKSGPQREVLEQRAEALEARRQDLEAMPQRESGYRYEVTDETFREYWNRLTQEERNMWLRDQRVKLYYSRTEDRGEYTHLETLHIDRMLASIDPSKSPEIFMLNQRLRALANRRRLGMSW